MTHFVLVHGAWHGSWCWDRVAAGLFARGHGVTAVDLPGRGGTPVRGGPFWGWRTGVPDSVAVVLRAIRAQKEPVVLVGHSLGGVSITQAGEDAAERIKSLVYLTAMLPANGQNVPALNKLMPRQDMRGKVKLRPLSGTLLLNFDNAAPSIYTDCTPEDIAAAGRQVVPELIGPSLSKVRTTPEKWGQLRKLYIQCLRDEVIPISAQRAMCENTGVSQIETLDTGHFPPYSMTERVVELLAAEG
jgi:pimeloyl-ACP methyl ester carboxylesterase